MVEGAVDQDTKPRAYSYIRFSDRSQMSGDSQRRQLERAVVYAAKMGLRLDESTTIRDLGISAFRGDHKRTGALGVFLTAVCEGKIERGSYLLIESMDRLSREAVASALSTFMQIIDAGIVIVTLIDEVKHSRETIEAQWGTLIYSISMMAQASEESTKKSNRLAAAWGEKRAKLRSGVIATSSCPGWLKREGSRFVILEDRARVVQRIFEDLVGGLGRQTIAIRLNKEGVRPFGHGASWHGGSIQKVTENAAVIGHYQPHSSSRSPVGEETGIRKSNGRVPMGPLIEDYYPPIITTELFLRARRVSQSRSVRPGNLGGRKGTAYSNLFTGIGLCAACKKPIIFQHQGPRSLPKLRCSGNRNGLCDNNWRYTYADLERQVLDWIDELEISDTRSEKLVMLADGAARLAMERETKAAKAKVLIDAFSSEPSQFATARVLELEREIDALDHQISEIKEEIQAVSLNPSADQRKAALREWRQAAIGLEGAALYSTRAKIAQSYRSIVRHMIFYQDGTVHVVLADSAKQYVFHLPGPARSSEYEVRVLDMRRPENWALVVGADEERQLLGAVAAVLGKSSD